MTSSGILHFPIESASCIHLYILQKGILCSLCSSVVIITLAAGTEILRKATYGSKSFFSHSVSVQPIVVGSVAATAGHVVSSARKQKEMNAGVHFTSLPCYLVRMPRTLPIKLFHPYLVWGLLSELTNLKFVSYLTLGSVRLTILHIITAPPHSSRCEPRTTC